MNKYHIATLLISLLAMCETAFAQFTQPLVTPSHEVVVDSIQVDTAPEVNATLYSEAYQKYLKSLQYWERNKFTITNSGLSLTQAMLDNWAAGGLNSFSARLYMKLAHSYTNEKTFTLATTLEGALSMVQSDGKFTKSEDWWTLTSKPSWTIAPKWSFSGDVMLKSQFVNAFTVVDDTTSTLASTFMSPGTLTVSAGFTYKSVKNNNTLTIYMAPASGNMVMVLNQFIADQGSYGAAGRQFIPTFGSLFRTEFSTKFSQDKVSYSTKLETYWNYDSDPTIYWENILNIKLTNILSFNFSLISKYYRTETPPRVTAGGNSFWDYCQINQSLGLSFSISYESKTPDKINLENIKPLTYK
ncbi:MAG: DUF3078 domain-containing protein [Rikenellaceae bacterium]